MSDDDRRRRPSMETPGSPTLRKMTQPYASVLVLADASLATELRALVDPRTGVIPVERASELVRAARVLRGQRRMIVLDLAQRPPLDALRSEPSLVEGALVILWRATREQEASFRVAFPGVTTVRAGERAGARELAAFVHMGQ